MIYVVDFARSLSLGVWAIAFLLSSRAAFKGFRGSSHYHDIDSMVFWGVSILCIGFGIRWLVFPSHEENMPPLELGFWAGLYVLSTAIAGAISILSKPAPRG